ncbi:hypothetical protein RCL1_003281 [Eukaryota sp. TZLM3-RCL]
MDNIDDPVVHELDVFLCHSLEENLFLAQFPTRPKWRPLSFDNMTSGKYKPQQGAVELEFDHDFPESAKDESSHPKSASLFTALSVPTKTNMTVGVIRGGQLFITPLHHIIQFRPRFRHLTDEGEEEMDIPEQTKMMTADDSESEVETSLIQQKIKNAASVKEATIIVRQSAYSKFKAKKSAEPWIPLGLIPKSAEVINHVRNALFFSNSTAITSTSSYNEFLTRLFPSTAPQMLQAASEEISSTATSSQSNLVVEQEFPRRRNSVEESPVLMALKEFLTRELSKYGVLNIASLLQLVSKNNRDVSDNQRLPTDSTTIQVVLSQLADHVGECYFLKKGDDEALETYRRIFINLLKSQGQIQKRDFTTACNAEKVPPFSDKIYSMLTSQLAQKAAGCHSKWELKSGSI